MHCARRDESEKENKTHNHVEYFCKHTHILVYIPAPVAPPTRQHNNTHSRAVKFINVCIFNIYTIA